MSDNTAENNEKSVEKSPIRFDDDQLAAIRTTEDLKTLLAQEGVSLVDVSEFGTGFELADSAALVNVPFVIVQSQVKDSDKFTDDDGNPAKFAVLHVVTQDGRKLVITDGGTGICKQIQRMHSKGTTAGIMVPKGLSESRYDYIDKDGKKTAAVTYYLAY